MYIIIDTNVVHSDPTLEKAGIRTLFAKAKLAQFQVLFPSTVITEMTKHFVQKIEEKLKSVEKAASDFSKTTGVDVLNHESLKLIDNYIQQYKQQLPKTISEFGGKIINFPSPQISASHVLDKSIYRKKPFKAKGDGYADAIIWESVLCALGGYKKKSMVKHPKVIFVTDNHSDFCESDNFELHQELLEELRTIEVDPSYLKIIRNLDQTSKFLNEYAATDEFLSQYTYDFISGKDFRHSPLEEDLADQIQFDLLLKTIDGNSIGLLDEFSEITISTIDRDYQYEDIEVESIGDDNFSVSMTVVADCILDLYMPKKILRSLEQGDLHYDQEWSNIQFSSQIEKRIWFRVRYITDKNLTDCTAFDIEPYESLNLLHAR